MLDVELVLLGELVGLGDSAAEVLVVKHVDVVLQRFLGAHEVKASSLMVSIQCIASKKSPI